MTNNLIHGLAVGAVLAGTAIGLAGHASADPAPGAYTATVTQASPPDIVNVGQTMDAMLSPCGPGCTKFLTSAQTAWFGDLHLQGDSYSGPLQNARAGGGDCTGTLDGGAQTFVINCPADGQTVTYAMTKNG